MSRLEFAPGVADDPDRIVEHLQRHAARHVAVRVGKVIRALETLVDNPLIGRPDQGDLRELVIGRGSHGYVALYQYLEALDVVLVLAVRAQREAGYRS